MSENARWYAVHVYSGFEKKVAESILSQVEAKGLKDQISQVLVPMEEFVEVKKGVKVNSERNFFPGYVLVKMFLTDDSWHLIKTIPKVTNFLGTDGKPSPVREAEVQRIIAQVEERHAKPAYTVFFEVGELVRVCDGPFNTFSGLVEEVDIDKQRVKVSVSIFGRPTPVDLSFKQIEKMEQLS